MKILVAHNSHLLPGGEDVVFKQECQALDGHGHQVIAYLQENSATIPHTPLWRVGMRALWSNQDYKNIRILLRERCPDILHVHNTFPLISPSIFYAAYHENVPTVLSLHNYRLLCLNSYLFRDGRNCEACLTSETFFPGVLHKCYQNSLPGSLVAFGISSLHDLLKTYRKHVDAFIVLTDFAKEKFISWRLPSEKIFVKPNFVHYLNQGTQEKENFFLYVGRLSPEKGLGLLLRAWSKYPSLPPIKIIGQGPLELDLMHAATEISQLEYLGQLPPNEVHKWMGKAKALIFPSQWYEGLPLTIIEAFAQGTPVIASRLGSMESLITHEYNGLHFEPGNIEDMVFQIAWVEQHQAEWSVMQQNARREFEAKYTEEQNYAALLNIYQQVLNKKLG